METMRTLSMKCAGCGGALQIADDMERFACGYCGVEQIVQRRGGTVALRQVTDAVGRVQKGTDRTAAELALRRLVEEQARLGREWQEMDYRLRIERSRAISPYDWLAVISMLAASLFLIVGLAMLADEKTGWSLPFFVFTAPSVGLLIYVLRRKRAAVLTYDERRRFVYQPYGDRFARIIEQIAANKAVVDAVL